MLRLLGRLLSGEFSNGEEGPAAASTRRVSRRTYHKPTAGSRSTAAVALDAVEPPAPEDERILDRLAVVRAPHAGHREPEAFVEQPCRLVGAADLERGPRRAQPRALVQHELEQRARDAG